MVHVPHLLSFAALLLAEPEVTSVWREPWSWEPAIVLPLLVMLLVYVSGALRRGHLRILRWRHASFLAGWITLALALTSPIHELGEQLFSAHMLQHEILILLSAPLISAAQPGATCLWAFAPAGRANLGGWVHTVEQFPPVRLLTRPLVAWVLEAAALWLFWSALYGVGRSAMSYGAATFYVFGTAVHCSALGALLTFSTVLWYPVYAKSTARWGLTPLADQQLGGAIMWVPSGLVFILIGLVLFAQWLNEADRRLKLGGLHSLTHRGEQHR